MSNTEERSQGHFKAPNQEIQDVVNFYSFAGVPDEHGMLPPATEANAHMTGVNAARDGKDLTDVVEVGMMRYPGTVHEVATLIAASCLGWFVTYTEMEGGEDAQ